MSKYNYITNLENKELVEKTSHAIEWEKCDMTIELLNKKADGLKRTIGKDTSTPAEITLAKERLKAVEADIEECKKSMDSLSTDHDDFVNVVSLGSNEYVTNLKNSVRNVLRLSACADNTRFFSIAIVSDITNDDFGKFYDTFKACHEYTADCNDNGIRKSTASLNDSFKKCNKLLLDESTSILRNMFSLPVATEYTKKVTVRFNKTDLMHLHDCFVRDIDVDVTKNRKTNDIVSVDGGYRYAIKKTIKRGETAPTYEGATFKGLIAKLAFMHLFG